MWHTFHQPTNQPFPYQQCFCHSPPSLFSLQALEGRGRGRKAKASKRLSPPPPQIPFRYTKSCGPRAKKDGRGEKISRHAKSGRMWRMRDEPRASGGKRGGGTTYARSWRVHRSISHITPHASYARGILRKISFFFSLRTIPSVPRPPRSC